MHGKIVSYQDSTGRGVVINIAKSLFDFNKETWHDPKVFPASGLLVECRIDGNRATDVHASKFQVFDSSVLVNEHDFWKTETDDELESIEEKKRVAAIQTISRNTDYAKLEDIDITITVAQAIKNYFVMENTTIDMIQEISHNHKTFILDYSLMKRFILKALDTLLFLDKSILKDRFAQYTGIIARLENSYKGMTRYSNVNIPALFDEYFLRHQIYYQALNVAISDIKDSLNLTNKHEQSLSKQISLVQKRIEVQRQNKDNHKPTPTIHDDYKQIENLQENLKKHKKDHHSFAENLKKLEAIRDDFYKRHFDTFNIVFTTTFNRITKKIKEGLNFCGSLLDDQIWEMSSHSSSLKAQHFKGGAEENVCSINFALFYLSHLDKYLLRDTEEALCKYCEKISNHMRRYFLIITSDTDFATDMKVKILALNKYYVVKHIHKLIALQTLINTITFEKIYFDENISWAKAEQIIQEVKDSKKNTKTEVKIVSKALKNVNIIV